MRLTEKMKKLLNVFSVWILAGVFANANAQCPTLYDLKINGGNEATICVPGQVELSVSGIQMPSKGTINWYYSENENFDPRTQGTLFNKTNLPEHTQQTCPVDCPDLLMIMMNSCDEDGIGVGKEHDNEFFIFSSGGGFFASDLQFKINSGTNDNTPTDKSINIGEGACQIQRPSNALMARLRTGACSNLNLFAAGPGDFIPSDALVLFFMSSNVAQDYDLTTLCNSGHNVYIMQNACQRTMGAFTNSSSTSNNAATRYRENFLSLKNCTRCTDSLNYDRRGMRDLEGEYIIDNDFQYASVDNGSIVLNEGQNPCQTPELSNYLKPTEPYKVYFGVPEGTNLCGKKIYFKAYVTPSDETICSNIIASGAALNIKCGGVQPTVTAPKAVCSGNPLEIKLEPAGEYDWNVSTVIVGGLSNGSGYVSSIIQTPVYPSGQQEVVTYTISSALTSCPIEPVKVQVVVGTALSANISGDTQICAGGKTTLSVNAGSAGILWSTGATTPSIEVTASGTYSVTLNNGVCEAKASVEVSIGDELKPAISGNTNICPGETTTLTVNEDFDTYTWSDGQTGKSITVSQTGNYTVVVTKGTCSGTASVQVEGKQITVTPTVTPPSCLGNDGSATVKVEEEVTYTITWTTGESTATITGKEAGVYAYTIQFGTCTQQGTVEIPESQDKITADIEVTPLNCDASEKGSISIADINGTAPFIIKLNGEIVAETIPDLVAGDYILVIEDGKGCSLQQTVNVFQAPEVEVILPQDVTIGKGQQITLQATVTGINIRPENTVYEWTPSDGLSCTDCAAPQAAPQQTTEYVLKVTNAFGCQGADTILVEVTPELTVYLPTAFSPNGDGKNDVLYIRSNADGANVKILEIFNRWGESVFRSENVAVNNPAFGWNGYYNGKLSAVDSYSFYYEVELSDSTVKRDKGTVLIVR